MVVKRDLRGIVTVLNTPFDGHDRVDLEALERNVARALDAGVAGFLVPAMASEVSALTGPERDAIVSRVVAASRGRGLVVGGSSAGDNDERVRNVRRVVELGCEAALVAVPYNDDAQYEQDVRAVATAGSPLLMVQDWDARGYGAPVPLIARLFRELESFRSIKIEVVSAGRKYSEVLAATGGEIHVAGGWAVSQMIEAFDRGVDALMPTAMHSIYAGIYRRYQEGDRDGARALFHRLLPVLAFSNQHLDVSILFFKRLLWKQGIYPTPACRTPAFAFDTVHERIADELIELVIELEAELEGASG